MKNYLVITGASRGIGFSTAEYFLNQGWSVINLSRSPCSLDSVENITLDFSNPSWQEHCKTTLLPLLKDVDKLSLVHNTGICVSDTVLSCEEESIRLSFELNVIAPMLLNSMILPLMKSGDSIIYIGSTLSEKAVKHSASYVASKHAIAGLMKATCQDLDYTGIHTCCVCPGVTNTEMLQDRAKEIPGLLEKLTSLSSAKRLIEPKEIAELIWFSSQHPVINGAMLHGNLGQIES